MKLWPSYSSRWGRLWDMSAGFITALLINAFILLLSDHGFSGYLFSFMPWVINGLFLFIFLLILPWFDLGYLLAVVITVGLSIVGLAMILAGRLLSPEINPALESLSASLSTLDQSDISLDRLSPNLMRFASAVDRAIHIPTTEAVGYGLLILVSLLIIVFLLQSIDRE